MKRRTKKIIAAGLSALLFFWYFSPAMTELRALPEGVTAGTAEASREAASRGARGRDAGRTSPLPAVAAQLTSCPSGAVASPWRRQGQRAQKTGEKHTSDRGASDELRKYFRASPNRPGSRRWARRELWSLAAPAPSPSARPPGSDASCALRLGSLGIEASLSLHLSVHHLPSLPTWPQLNAIPSQTCPGLTWLPRSSARSP